MLGVLAYKNCPNLNQIFGGLKIFFLSHLHSKANAARFI